MAAITLRPVDPRPSHCSRHPLNSPFNPSAFRWWQGWPVNEITHKKFPAFNNGLGGKMLTKAAEGVGLTEFEAWMRTPGATQAFRVFGVVGGLASTGLDVKKLIDQGDPRAAYEREGAGYVADVARTGFSASSTAFLIAPNPVTAGLMVGTGVVWIGAETWDTWGDDISEHVDDFGKYVEEQWDIAGRGWRPVENVVSGFARALG